jgi:hypothetical protein
VWEGVCASVWGGVMPPNSMSFMPTPFESQLVCTPYTLHTTHYTLHTTPCTLHTTHYTLHTAHYTLHTTHCTLHTTHYTLHPMPLDLVPPDPPRECEKETGIQTVCVCV